MAFVESPDPRLDDLWSPMVSLLKQASGLLKYPVGGNKYALREQDSGLFLNLETGTMRWSTVCDDGTLMPRDDAKELAQYFMWRAHQRGLEVIVHFDLAKDEDVAPDYLPEHIDESVDDALDYEDDEEEFGGGI
jgi:hypothetical protein